MLSTLRRGLGSIFAFEVLCKLLTAIIMTPLAAWLLATLIAWSGNGAVSNYDLVSFFLSPQGLLFGTAAATLAFAIFFFELGGLVALWISLRSEGELQPVLVLQFLLRSLLNLWKLSWHQFIRYVLVALPGLTLAAVAFFSFLTKNDMNYYLQTKPAEYWWALSLIGLGALSFAILALRLFVNWIFSVPILLFEGRLPAEALRESVTLAHGRRKGVLLMLGKWLLLTVLVSATAGIALSLLSTLLMGLAGDHVRFALAAAAWLAVIEFILAALVGGAALALLACLVGERYRQWRPVSSLPSTLLEGRGIRIPALKKLVPAGWTGVLILCLLTALASYRLIHKVNFDNDVLITAHRGSSITAPENTMAAITLAMDEGADVIEIDVQETKDGTIVLLHDKDLKRVTGIDKGIWEVTYDEIKDLDIGSWFDEKYAAERVPTLKHVINTVRGRCRLNIELKFNGHDVRLAEEVVRILNAEGFRDQCVLTSLKYDGLQEAKEADPNAVTGLIVTAAVGDVTKLKVDFLSVSAASVNRDLIDRAHGAEKEVHVWTVNEVSQMNIMIGLGVDNIITDVPALLADLKEERKSLTKAEKALLQLANLSQGRL